MIETPMPEWLTPLQTWLDVPSHSLGALFVIALVSATLLPMGSEPVVLAIVSDNPDLFWPAVLVATLGNTLGGAISWGMGALARTAWQKAHPQPDATPAQTEEKHWTRRWGQRWLQRMGPKACLLSWLPGVGDPLCAVAGWLKLPFWPCLAYMAVGKLLRYVVMTAALMHMLPIPEGWLTL